MFLCKLAQNLERQRQCLSVCRGLSKEAYLKKWATETEWHPVSGVNTSASPSNVKPPSTSTPVVSPKLKLTVPGVGTATNQPTSVSGKHDSGSSVGLGVKPGNITPIKAKDVKEEIGTGNKSRQYESKDKGEGVKPEVSTFKIKDPFEFNKTKALTHGLEAGIGATNPNQGFKAAQQLKAAGIKKSLFNL